MWDIPVLKEMYHHWFTMGINQYKYAQPKSGCAYLIIKVGNLQDIGNSFKNLFPTITILSLTGTVFSIAWPIPGIIFPTNLKLI